MSWTITQAAAAMRAYQLTSVDLVQACFDRIDRLESTLHAWVHLDREDALLQAKAADARLAIGADPGLLNGIPFGIKDIIDVAEMPTAAGSKRWANSIARQDAACVASLRKAGAVILGKTVTTAYALFDPPPTLNPWDLSRTPGGSSSGSAVAVASGMCLAALGSQTGGSLARPASYCGVCSLKPSYGRISVQGVVPLAPSLDHVGFVAKTVDDLITIFRALTPTSSTSSESSKEVTFVRIPEAEESVAPEILATLEVTWKRLALTFSLSQVSIGNMWKQLLSVHRKIMMVEIYQTHSHRLQRFPDDYPTKIREAIAEGASITQDDYLKALEERLGLQAWFQSTFDSSKLLLTPATLDLPPDRTTTGSPAMNSPWSLVGFPTISRPIGWSETGLPIAMQITSTVMDESNLFDRIMPISQQRGSMLREVC
jgi:aspartyl-tRNA(Asn)/glutamyl-tRNA(Gln) amidotransferase subunit A